MSMDDYLLEQCRRRNVALRIVDGDIEIEFDRNRPPHDLIEQLRVHKARSFVRCCVFAW